MRPYEMLPHSFPFALLDEISVESPGKKGTGMKRITGSDFFTRGSDYPQMLLVESAAQLSGIVLGGARRGFLAGMRDLIFQPGVKTDGAVDLEAELEGASGNLYAFSIRAFSGGRQILEGVIYLAMA